MELSQETSFKSLKLNGGNFIEATSHSLKIYNFMFGSRSSNLFTNLSLQGAESFSQPCACKFDFSHMTSSWQIGCMYLEKLP